MEGVDRIKFSIRELGTNVQVDRRNVLDKFRLDEHTFVHSPLVGSSICFQLKYSQFHFVLPPEEACVCL